jgi:hypothetical protein
MLSVRDEAEKSINNFLTEQKAVEGECSLSIYEFSNLVASVYSGPLREFGDYALLPSGMTALNDAVGTAINETGDFLKRKKRSERPTHVVFVVMTDGNENMSREFSGQMVAEMVAHQEEKYSWQFVFLGAGLVAAQQASTLGFSPKNTITLRSSTGVAFAASYAGVSANLTATRGGSSVSYGAFYDESGNLVENTGASK